MKIKFAELLGKLSGNMTVHAHCNTVADAPATVSKDGLKLSADSWAMKDYKYPVTIDWDLPFSAPMCRLTGNTKLLLEDGTVVNYRKMVGNTEWMDTDGVIRSNMVLVTQYSEDNAVRIVARMTREKLKADYLKDNLHKQLTYGFEFETHETEGSNNSKLITEDAVVEKRLKERAESNMEGVLSLVHNDDPTIQVLKKIGKSKFGSSALTITDDIKKHVVDTLLAKKSSLPLAFHFDLPDNIEVGYDGSVKGFEFRTIGGLQGADYDAAATQLLSLKHKTDSKCSLHVHVGSKNIELPKSRSSQQHMINYIVSDERVPSTVRTRWASEFRRFFSISSDGASSKDSFVRIHPQGTLEFRCFGNIKNAADAIMCRQIAVDAVSYAMTQSFTDFGDGWGDRVLDAMDNKKVIPQLRYWQQYQDKLKKLEAEFELKRKELEGSL